MTITNGYCTLAQLKLKKTGVEDDPELEDEITAASREIDAFCGDQFFQQTDTIKYFNGSSYPTLYVHPYLATMTLVEYLSDVDLDGVEEWTELEDDDVETDGRSVRMRAATSTDTDIFGNVVETVTLGKANTQFPSGKRNIRITGTWGRAAVPQGVKDACIQRAIERLNERYDPVASQRNGALSLAKRHKLEPLAGGAVG